MDDNTSIVICPFCEAKYVLRTRHNCKGRIEADRRLAAAVVSISSRRNKRRIAQKIWMKEIKRGR